MAKETSGKTVRMSATSRSGETRTMTSDDSKTGRTQASADGSVVQTDGDQVIRD